MLNSFLVMANFQKRVIVTSEVGKISLSFPFGLCSSKPCPRLLLSADVDFLLTYKLEMGTFSATHRSCRQGLKVILFAADFI